jgi:hypothetical protein
MALHFFGILLTFDLLGGDLNYDKKRDAKAARLARDLLRKDGFLRTQGIFSRRPILHLSRRFLAAQQGQRGEDGSEGSSSGLVIGQNLLE